MALAASIGCNAKRGSGRTGGSGVICSYAAVMARSCFRRSLKSVEGAVGAADAVLALS